MNEAAVAGDFALVGGYSAWFLSRLIEGVGGGLEAVLARSGVPVEHRASVLRAQGALREVGAAWRLEAASASGREGGESADSDVTSDGRVVHQSSFVLMGSEDVASVLGLTGRRVRALAVAGELRGRRDHGGRWLFEVEDVDAYKRLREQRQAA